jgi:hypothetical protein
MITQTHSNKGLIRTIVLVVIALLILSYFGFNLRNLADSPTTQDNFHYALNFVVDIWNNYLKAPVMYVWDIFVTYVWNPAFNLLQKNAATGESAFISTLS